MKKILYYCIYKQLFEVGMDNLHTAVLLERIALIAKLSTCVECDVDERELVSVWISEMAESAKKGLLATVFNVNGPGKIH